MPTPGCQFACVANMWECVRACNLLLGFVCWITHRQLSVDRRTAATCCLTKQTAQLDQSHVGHQHSSGTSVDELISSFVSISSAASLSPSLCFKEERGVRGSTGLDYSRMRIAAINYLPCTVNMQEMSCWHCHTFSVYKACKQDLKYPAKQLQAAFVYLY